MLRSTLSMTAFPNPLLHGKISEPQLVTIPAGWFLMGSENGQDNERPIHRVWIDAFRLAALQVTNIEYALFLRQVGKLPPPFWRDSNFNHPQQPVVGVSWHDAAAYCTWLTASTDRPYRLPTEAEWERAARGGVEGALYPWGDAGPEVVPDYTKRWKLGAEPVGMYAANAYGLYNMGDNVHEWCADWYDDGYYARSPERNPQGPASGSRRASRGGSGGHPIKGTRAGG